jgi:hypothetical protein
MKFIARAAALLLGLAVPPAMVAAILQPLSLATLTTNADVVVHARVIGKTVQRDPAGRIYTRVQLDITEVWKGAVPPGFTLVHSGGRLGDVEARASVQVNYEIGEEVVAMVRRNERGEGVTLGLGQGKFCVETEPATGEKLVHNPFHGQAVGKAPTAAANAGVQPRLTLTELKRQVQAGGTR